MRQLHIYIACILTALCAEGALGQYTREPGPFPVADERGTTLFPFLGGINFPKPLLIDFDHDSRYDLFLADQWGKLAYFHNDGSAQQAFWTPVTDHFGGVDIGTWFTLCDIDDDNDFDLFCDNRIGGVDFWQNQSIGSAISFTLVDSVYGDTAVGGFQTGINNTGTFVDIDGDSDLDFFYGGLGGNLVFYRNTGTPSNAVFAFITELYDSVIAFPQGAATPRQNPKHGFSTICFADINADNDLDLFFGDIYNSNVYLFSNLGTPTVSDLNWTTQDYLASPTTGFNHETFADLDADGDLDLVIGVAQGDTKYNVRLYANLGTPQNASFFLADSAIIHTLDFGSSAVPALADLDDDRDLDLLVGAEDGTLNYFENTGTIFTPSLEYQTNYFAGIHGGFNTSPELADLDSDGDLDLLVGNLTGQIGYWNNVGTKSNFVPQLVTNKLAGVKIDQLATPRLIDLNSDSLLDLVVGEWDFNGFANLLLYQNTGTASSPAFALVTATLLKKTFRDMTVPEIVDWDHDGKLDFLVGGRNSSATIYRNTAPNGQFPDSITLVPLADSVPGSSDGARLAFALGDVDADGDLDIISGEDDGGLNFYRHTGSCCAGTKGNVDNDPLNGVDISDLTALIDGMFISLAPFPCPVSANIDNSSDGNIDIADLTELIAHLFIDLGPLRPCQ